MLYGLTLKFDLFSQTCYFACIHVASFSVDYPVHSFPFKDAYYEISTLLGTAVLHTSVIDTITMGLCQVLESSMMKTSTLSGEICRETLTSQRSCARKRLQYGKIATCCRYQPED